MSYSATLWTAALQASLSITNSRSLLKLISIESMTQSNHLILCCPLLPPPSSLLSIRVFSNESVLHIKWPKYWSFGFSISPSNEYSGLISFRMDWLDLLVVHKPLESSPAPRSESIHFLALRLPYRPSLICIHGYWKKHSFYYINPCLQSDVIKLYFLSFSIQHNIITYLESGIQSPSVFTLWTT